MDGAERWRILRLHVEDEIPLAELARYTKVSLRTLERWHRLFQEGGIAALDPGLVTLALEGPASYRDRHELVYHRRAEWPNQIWQAEHTELDILIIGANGKGQTANGKRQTGPALADRRDRRLRPGNLRIHRLHRRTLSPEHSTRTAAGNLAQTESVLGDVRTARHPARRPRL